MYTHTHRHHEINTENYIDMKDRLRIEVYPKKEEAAKKKYFIPELVLKI